MKEKLAASEKKLEGWLEEQKVIIKNEKLRYKEEQEDLKHQLEVLINGVPEEMEEEEVTLDELLTSTPTATTAAAMQMEARALQAERQAWEAQQSLLQMQSQMQQYMAYQMQQPVPMPLGQDMPMAPEPTPSGEHRPPPQHGPPGMAKPGSPQQVRRVRQNGLKLKDSKGKETGNKADNKNKEVKKKAPAVTVSTQDSNAEDVVDLCAEDGQEEQSDL